MVESVITTRAAVDAAPIRKLWPENSASFRPAAFRADRSSLTRESLVTKAPETKEWASAVPAREHIG